MSLAIWRESASLINIPLRAQLPIPAVSAVGVARPREQGQAITRTVTIEISPMVSPLPEESRNIQHKSVNRDNPMITGTNTAATLSTVCCILALLPWASLTILMMEDNIVSFPTFSALMTNDPLWFKVPVKTLEPTVLWFPTGSPVSILSSTNDSPSITSPSAGILSPGFTV